MDQDRTIFDVGINEKLRPARLLLLGMQNVFGMTGMFVFPGILGRSFHLPPETIAYIYGMAFIACGLTTVFQSIVLLRLPIVQGPYAGSFVALLAVGHSQIGGLGAAYGSFFVAALILTALSIPLRGWSFMGALSRYFSVPMISGMFVLLIMVQIAGVAFPNWIGLPNSPGFPFINFFSGGIAVVVIMAIMLLNRSWLRYSAILSGLLVGTLCYTLFRPISFASIATAPIFVTPKLFPFGFEVNPSLVLVFLMVLIPAAFGSMALYRTVADWGQEVLTSERMSEGAFACALGAVVASILGSFSTIVYPDNIGMLRATRVGSRYATLAAGVLLVVFGGCIKFDMLLVLVPIPVISAAATLLYGIVFMHGIQILTNSSWNDRRLLVAGLSFFVGLGGLFISPAVLQALPLFLRLIVEQPVVCGGVTLIVLYSLLCGDQKQTVELQTSSS